MRTNLFISLVAAITFGLLSFTPQSAGLEIGDAAPKTEVALKAVDGTSYNLNKLKKKNGLLVIFSCNTCPFVVGTADKEGWEGRYNGIYDLVTKLDVGMVLVNSNEAFRKNEDSFEKMKARATAQKYKSPYVVDKDHVLADAFGAKTTPHVFLFDADMKLVYRGAIDDNNANQREVREHYLRDALFNLSTGAKIDPNSTKALGCSIKRVKV
jgi:peroxiredoxin